MIIELCGLPGCGKSTLSKELLRIWRGEAEGETVYDREDVLKKNLALRAMDRVLFDKWSGGQRKELIKIIYKNAKHDSDWERRYVHRLLELTEGIRRKCNENIFLDEGLIQYITSLSYVNPLMPGDELECLIERVFPDNIDYYVVNCEIPVEIAMKRVKQRNRKNDRYNVDIADMQKELMNVKKENICVLLESRALKRIKVINIGMMDKADKNAESVWRFVKNSRSAMK